jgi:hypothetical protein
MCAIIDCYDSAYTYISEIDNDENFNPLDNNNTGDFDIFIGAYVGCIIGSVINKVINKPIDNIQLKTINDSNNNQININKDIDNTININEHIDNIVANINDGDYIAYNEIYIDGKIVELSQHTVNVINKKLKARTLQNIKLFNKENKEIIKHTKKHLDLSQNVKDKIDTQLVEYNNFIKHNPIKIEESFKTFIDVMDEKNNQYFLESGYHTYHNVLPKPTLQTIKCHGEGKLGNFILMIPIITIPFGCGGGGGGGGGCSIL